MWYQIEAQVLCFQEMMLYFAISLHNVFFSLVLRIDFAKFTRTMHTHSLSYIHNYKFLKHYYNMLSYTLIHEEFEYDKHFTVDLTKNKIIAVFFTKKGKIFGFITLPLS